MVNINDIHSLSDFQRNTKDFVKQLESNKKPVVLTINGKAALVVQDATAYQTLLDQLELALSVATIKERSLQFHREQIEFDATEALEKLRGELEIPC
ncbi:MAG: type II toxin-antitoxin system Phd/YefM family antitoxin [Symploca sp. SIO2B6]|nr:type II toxin-antitoxin system Phd/YefM family antitoxin [Symploca sp. SIO2B6]